MSTSTSTTPPRASARSTQPLSAYHVQDARLSASKVASVGRATRLAGQEGRGRHALAAVHTRGLVRRLGAVRAAGAALGRAAQRAARVAAGLTGRGRRERRARVAAAAGRARGGARPRRCAGACGARPPGANCAVAGRLCVAACDAAVALRGAVAGARPLWRRRRRGGAGSCGDAAAARALLRGPARLSGAQRPSC
jgi:hypothetical protein